MRDCYFLRIHAFKLSHKHFPEYFRLGIHIVSSPRFSQRSSMLMVLFAIFIYAWDIEPEICSSMYTYACHIAAIIIAIEWIHGTGQLRRKTRAYNAHLRKIFSFKQITILYSHEFYEFIINLYRFCVCFVWRCWTVRWIPVWVDGDGGGFEIRQVWPIYCPVIGMLCYLFMYRISRLHRSSHEC